MNKILTRIAFLTTKQVMIIAVAAGGLYWYTLFDDGSSLDPQIASLQQNLSDQQKKKLETEAALKQRDHLQEILANLTTKYENLSRLVPIELNSSELNRQLDQIQKMSRINQTFRKPGKIERVGLLDEWPVEMSFIGAYNDIAQFVYQASTTEKIMLVKKLKITSPETYDGRLTFEVTVAAVKLAQAPPAAAPNQPPNPPGVPQ